MGFFFQFLWGMNWITDQYMPWLLHSYLNQTKKIKYGFLSEYTVHTLPSDWY